MKIPYTLFLILLISVCSCNNSRVDTAEAKANADSIAKEKIILNKINTFVGSYLNKRDEKVLSNILTENYVRNMNGITVASNSEELKAAMNIFFIGFPDSQLTNLTTNVKNGRAYVQWVFTGTNSGIFAETPATGKKVKVGGFSELYFNDDGKMYQEDIYFNELSFLQQLGYTLIPPITK